jgi:hypothetical protein
MMIVLLVAMTPVSSRAIDIAVTPSVLDLVSDTAVVDGFELFGALPGDEFTLGFSVENRDGDELKSLFTSIIFDPAALGFLGGAAAPILEDPPGGGINAVSLSPIRAPEPRVGSPAGTLIALTHVAPFGSDRGTTQAGPDLAIAVTFQVLDVSVPTVIYQAFLPGDAAVINDINFCGVGSSPLSCDVPSDSIFDFQDFRVIPEPSTALLFGLGLAGLAVRRA